MTTLTNARGVKILDVADQIKAKKAQLADTTVDTGVVETPRYSETYGTNLTASQEEEYNKSQADFNTRITNAEKEWGDANTKIADATTTLSGARKKIEDAYNLKPSTLPAYDSFRQSLGDTSYSTWMSDQKYDSDGMPIGEPTPKPTTATKMDEYYERAMGEGARYFDTEEGMSKVNEDILNQKLDEYAKSDYVTILSKDESFINFKNDWMQKSTVPVTIDNTKGFKKTYYVDPATAAKIGTTDLAGYGAVSGNANEGYYVTSDTYAGNFIKPLEIYELNTTVELGKAFQNRKPISKEEYDRMQGELSTYEEKLKTSSGTLAARQQEINDAKAKNTIFLGSLRSKYANKLKATETIGAIPRGKSK